MTADEIVRLKVTTEGDQTALLFLTKIDKLIDKINRESANVKVTSSGTAEVLKELMSIADLIRQINQTPINVAASGLSDMESAARKAAEAASQYVENTNALVPAYSEAVRVGDQVVLCEQQILGAAENRISAYDKAKEAAGNIIDVEYTIVEEEGKAANAAENTAKAKENVAKSTENASKKQKEFNALASYLGIRILRSITQNIKKATDELKAMNAEMVSVQKVTGATDADMERLKNSAFEVAGALGSTPSDYLSSVTKWAQAGYGALSEQLGELSAKTQVVGDVNEETANKFLLAVDAAYKYKGNIDALTRVLDGANEISNNYATEVDKLANGMGIVSSLAEQAGMKVEETMAAIGTITAKTRESGNSAARALRALILNIQGSTEIEIDAETGERWTEDEIQRTAVVLGKLNIATREYKDGIMQLRNPMEAIGELAKKYRDGLVTEAQLQEVVSSLGGKVRSNQLMALIQGYETYTSMIETYKDAVGSADKELEIYLNGWEAKSNRLTAQWTEFIESFNATDISIGILDFGNDLLELANANEWTTLAAHILTLTAAFTGLNMVLTGTGMAKAVSAFFTNIITSAASASGAMATFGAVVNASIGWVGLAAVAITALVGAIDAATVSAEEQRQKTAEAVRAYEQEKAALEGLQNELKTTQDRIDELNGKESLSVVEQEELDKLKEQNRDLEWQITLEEKLAEAKKKTAEAETNKSLAKGWTGADYSYDPAREFLGDEIMDGGGRDIKYELGQRSGFEGQAKYMIGLLDDLYEKKQKFLSDNGEDARKWPEEASEEFEKLKGEIENAQGIAAEIYSELYGHVDNLPEGANHDHWRELSVALREAIDPAKAMTDRLNELVGAMDEAEKTRFDEMLSRLQKDGKVTDEEVQTLIDKFPTLKVLLEGNAGALDTLVQYFTESAAAAREAEDGIDGVGNAAEDTEKDIDTLTTTLKTAVSGMEAMKDAQDELARNGRLSTNTILSLMGKYGDALDEVLLKHMGGVATQEEVNQALEKAYQEDLANYRAAILEKEMDNEDYYASWLAANTDTVNKLLTQYGIDATNYKTLAQLKEAIENGTQTALTSIERGGANDRIKIFGDIQKAFETAQDAMVLKAQGATGAISGMYGALAGAFGKFGNWLGGLGDQVSGFWEKVKQNLGLSEDEKNSAWGDVTATFTPPSYTGSSASSRGSGGSGKSWYETQTDNLNKLVEQTKRTNQVLERSDQDTAQARVDNLKKVQDQILAAQKQFIARGLAENSDEVNQLKLMYAGLGDDIKSIYADMAETIEKKHEDIIFQFESKALENRTIEQMAADDAAMLEEYRKMMEEEHQLAEYYRSQGVREDDEAIRNRQKKYQEYRKSIETVFENLLDAFNDYIDESNHKIEELGRTAGTVGKRIEEYARQIETAQRTISTLKANNINGINDGYIFEMESNLWGIQDKVKDEQQELWDELERAFDDIFDRAQADVDAIGDEIEAIQDQMDGINDILEEYDKELEGILKPINDTLEKLNDQLEAEKKRLEERTQPLEDRRQGLEDQISGYYTVNPDGSIGPYIKGLDDSIDEIQDQIDKANEELDRVNDAWNEQKDREEEALALQKKQLAVEEAQKAVEEAMLALQTARNERNIYTLKDGEWAWRADEEAVAKAEKALADAEKAKEEAEKDLQDYKEEQAHKQIVKRLEEQIKALEDQKKLLDKQKDLINKQIDALNKQIKAYERESQARQEYIQDLIDRKEEEKKSWEDHYEALKEQYNDQLSALEHEKKLADERKKQAEKQYDDWMDTWKDIQKSIEAPARDLSDILNDIAKYGTPAMADQVDRVTDLLRDLGYAIEGVTGGGGYNPDDGWNGGSDGSDMSREEIIDRMIDNAYAWERAASQAERDRLMAENQRLGAMIGANYDPDSGRWDIFDYSGGQITVKPWAYGGYSSQGLTAYSPGDNDGWEDTKAQYGILSAEDYAPVRPPVAPGYNPVTNTYSDNHSITMNGVTIGSSMVQRPLSDTLRLIGLNMGT